MVDGRQRQRDHEFGRLSGAQTCGQALDGKTLDRETQHGEANRRKERWRSQVDCDARQGFDAGQGRDKRRSEEACAQQRQEADDFAFKEQEAGWRRKARRQSLSGAILELKPR